MFLFDMMDGQREGVGPEVPQPHLLMGRTRQPPSCELGLLSPFEKVLELEYFQLPLQKCLATSRFCLVCVFSGPQLVRFVCAEYMLIAYLNVDVCDKIIPPVILF